MYRYLAAAGLSALAIIAVAGTTLAVTAPAPVPATPPGAVTPAQTDTPTAPDAAPGTPAAPLPEPAAPPPSAAAEPPPPPDDVVEEVWPMPVEDFLAGKYLERADVVLTRREWDISSWAIRWATSSPFSHAAMVFTGPQFESGYTSTFVIESGTSGVDLTNLRDYIADKSAFIAIKRFRQPWFDEAKQSRVRGLLLDKIKASYNYWAIGTIARNLWFGVERSVSGDRTTMRRFRERNWDAPTEFICSGLVQIGFVEAALEYIKAGTLPPTALNEVVFEPRGGDAAARARGLELSRRGVLEDDGGAVPQAELRRAAVGDARGSRRQREARVAVLHQERTGLQGRQLRRRAQADRVAQARQRPTSSGSLPKVGSRAAPVWPAAAIRAYVAEPVPAPRRSRQRTSSHRNTRRRRQPARGHRPSCAFRRRASRRASAALARSRVCRRSRRRRW